MQRSKGNVTTSILILKPIASNDAGQYECQLSSTPKLSNFVRLEVVVPEVKIIGPKERFITAGSDHAIECVAQNVIEKPEFFTWIFNGKVRFSG